MKAKKEKIFICQEMDEILKQRVDHLVKISLINQRKRWISDYIEKNFTKFMTGSMAFPSLPMYEFSCCSDGDL